MRTRVRAVRVERDAPPVPRDLAARREQSGRVGGWPLADRDAKRLVLAHRTAAGQVDCPRTLAGRGQPLERLALASAEHATGRARPGQGECAGAQLAFIELRERDRLAPGRPREGFRELPVLLGPERRGPAGPSGVAPGAVAAAPTPPAPRRKNA